MAHVHPRRARSGNAARAPACYNSITDIVAAGMEENDSGQLPRASVRPPHSLASRSHGRTLIAQRYQVSRCRSLGVGADDDALTVARALSEDSDGPPGGSPTLLCALFNPVWLLIHSRESVKRRSMLFVVRQWRIFASYVFVQMLGYTSYRYISAD